MPARLPPSPRKHRQSPPPPDPAGRVDGNHRNMAVGGGRVRGGGGGKCVSHYRFLKVVGKGGFGVASLVEDLDLANESPNKRLLIAKEINLGQMSDKERDGTMNEIILLCQFSDHPYVVKYKEAFLCGTILYIIMDYCEKGDLQKQIDEKRRRQEYLTEETVMKYFAQIAGAVYHMHLQKVLHRDLKLANVLLDATKRVRVSDFGISKSLGSDELAKTRIGTVTSMSPEVLKGEPYSYPSDVWSLGCILYHLIALREPFGGLSMTEIIRNVKSKQPQLLPDTVSRSVRDLCYSMLHKDPQKRPTMRGVIASPDVKKALKQLLQESEDAAEKKASAAESNG
eukprot:GHVQ01032353.1.p1 GENE.GHVQ01032353.1~~GHVQ01032353.1.p1  ORF type:complete len:340 (-),score=52.83 GHVQ01032353.1:864-1883(-)